MKFQSSVVGKIILILLCLLLGVIIAVGGEVGAVYYILTKTTVNDLAGRVSPALPENTKLEFDEETGKMTVLNWGRELISTVGNMSTATVGQLEGMIGTSVVSNALYEIIGADKETVKASTFGGLGEAISSSLTLNTVSEKFKIELPDMPLFSDSEFMNEPLTTAFASLTDKELKQFVKMEEGKTNTVLLKMQDLTLKDLGTEKLTETINDIRLNEIIDIQEGVSNAVLVALQNTTVGELGGSGASDIVNSLFLCEIMDINDSSEQIMKALKFATIGSKTIKMDKDMAKAGDIAYRASDDYTYSATYEADGYTYIYAEDGTPYVLMEKNGEPVYDPVTNEYTLYETKYFEKDGEGKYRPIIGVNDTIGTLKIKDVMDTTDSRIMQSLSESTLDSLGNDINKLFLDEIMEIDATSSKTIQALRYAALKTATITTSEMIDYSVPGKELDGYVYKYILKDGEYIPYVAKITSTGEIERQAGEYVLIETKEYDGYYRPIVSIDDSVNKMFMAELLDAPESKTLQSLLYSSLQSLIVKINASTLDVSTATYVASDKHDASKEADGFIYKYSALGLAYIAKTDDFGEPVKEDGAYVLYETKSYDGKYYPLRGIDDKIKVITFGEVVEIDESDPNTTPLMKSLKNTRVDKMSDTVNRLYMGEMIDITPSSAQVLQAIQYSALQDAITFIPIAEATTAVPSEYLAKEMPEYTYYYMEDGRGGYTPYVFIETVGDTYKVYETKEYDGYFRPIIGLDNKLQELTMGDVFSEEEMKDGVLSLIPRDTKTSELGDVVGDQLTDATLAKLNGVGVLEVNASSMTNTRKEQKAFIWNNSMSSMLDGVFDFIGDPVSQTLVAPYYEINYSKISAPVAVIDQASYTLSEFLAKYNQFDTLDLQTDVIVNLDPTTDAAYFDAENEIYFIPAFNVDDSSYAITFQTGVYDFALAVYEYDEFNAMKSLSDKQYFYSYDGSLSGTGSGLRYFEGYDEHGTEIVQFATNVGSYMEYSTVSLN